MQARSLAAPARALAAAGVLHLVFGATPAASRSQNATEAVRARAEELAEAATRRFDELQKGRSPAQAEPRGPSSSKALGRKRLLGSSAQTATSPG